VVPATCVRAATVLPARPPPSDRKAGNAAPCDHSAAPSDRHATPSDRQVVTSRPSPSPGLIPGGRASLTGPSPRNRPGSYARLGIVGGRGRPSSGDPCA